MEMMFYVPRVGFNDDGELEYRAVHRYEGASLHIVYTPSSRSMYLFVEPSRRWRIRLVEELHKHQEDVHWWMFQVNEQMLRVRLLQDKPLGENIHAQGVALAVEMLQAKSQEVLP